jgi:pyruvate kinase
MFENKVHKNNFKIIATMKNIRNEDLIEDFLFLMENAKKFSLKGIRINFKNFDDKENYRIIINELFKLKKGAFDLMIDLPYPYSKIRGRLKNTKSLTLTKDETLYIAYKELKYLSGPNIIYVSEEGYEKLKKSDNLIFYGDGKGAFEVITIANDYMSLRSIKEQTFYTTHSFITKDLLEVRTANDFFENLNNSEYHPDTIALSFVKSKEDILSFKSKINFDARIVSKIETQSAVDNIDEIINISDAIMLARGDLAFAVNIKEFNQIQEMIIKKCEKNNKELIMATDILSSLEYRSFPSRSDIIDFQNIFTRVDGVVLSGDVSYKHMENSLIIIDLIV